jgi:serine/threonine protein kinase
MAPEVGDDDGAGDGLAAYGPPADVWSAGVLLYAVALRVSPAVAPDASDDGTVAAVARALSPAGAALLWRMVDPDPAARPTALGALADPWFDPLRVDAAAVFGDPTLEAAAAGAAAEAAAARAAAASDGAAGRV